MLAEDDEMAGSKLRESYPETAQLVEASPTSSMNCRALNVGAVADVEVNRKTGDIRVNHVAIVQDCGQIINPDGVRNQIEGNVVQTVSRTLKEQVTFHRSHVTSVDWSSYPILRFPDVPQVDIELIDRPTEKPWGVGEPAASVVPSAIANAVFDAVAVRLRSVPFTPGKVNAALQNA